MIGGKGDQTKSWRKYIKNQKNNANYSNPKSQIAGTHHTNAETKINEKILTLKSWRKTKKGASKNKMAVRRIKDIERAGVEDWRERTKDRKKWRHVVRSKYIF